MRARHLLTIVLLFFFQPKAHSEAPEWQKIRIDSLFVADFPLAPRSDTLAGFRSWLWELPGARGAVKRLAPQPGSEPLVTDAFHLQEYYDGLARGLHNRLNGELERDSAWRWGALQGRYLRWRVESGTVPALSWRHETLLLEIDQATYLLESACTGAACAEISKRWLAGFQPIRPLPAARQYLERPQTQPVRLPWLRPVAWIAFIVLLALAYRLYARRSGAGRA